MHSSSSLCPRVTTATWTPRPLPTSSLSGSVRLDALEHDARVAPLVERRRELPDAQRARLVARGEERARVTGERLVERLVARRAGQRARLPDEDFRSDPARGLDDRGERGHGA